MRLKADQCVATWHLHDFLSVWLVGSYWAEEREPGQETCKVPTSFAIDELCEVEKGVSLGRDALTCEGGWERRWLMF